MDLPLTTDLRPQALRCRLYVDFSSEESCHGRRKVLTSSDDDVILVFARHNEVESRGSVYQVLDTSRCQSTPLFNAVPTGTDARVALQCTLYLSIVDNTSFYIIEGSVPLPDASDG